MGEKTAQAGGKSGTRGQGRWREEVRFGVWPESREGLQTVGLQGGVGGPPTPLGQQTHPTRGFGSSKLPHRHVGTHGSPAHSEMHTRQADTRTALSTHTNTATRQHTQHACARAHRMCTHTTHKHTKKHVTETRIQCADTRARFRSCERTVLSAHPASPRRAPSSPLRARPGSSVAELVECPPLPLGPCPVLATRCTSCSIRRAGVSLGHTAGVGRGVNNAY